MHGTLRDKKNKFCLKRLSICRENEIYRLSHNRWITDLGVVCMPVIPAPSRLRQEESSSRSA
jgi:hypothetical protein